VWMPMLWAESFWLKMESRQEKHIAPKGVLVEAVKVTLLVDGKCVPSH